MEVEDLVKIAPIVTTMIEKVVMAEDKGMEQMVREVVDLVALDLILQLKRSYTTNQEGDQRQEVELELLELTVQV